MGLIHYMLGYRRLLVTEGHRVLVMHRGRYTDILRPGVRYIPRKDSEIEVLDIGDLFVRAPVADAVQRARPDLYEAHFERVETGPDEVGVLFRDGRVVHVMAPAERAVMLRDAGPFRLERVDVTETVAVPRALAAPLDRDAPAHAVTHVEVPEGHVGLVTVAGADAGVIGPGRHRYFALPERRVAVRLVDTRTRTYEVTGQEILTRDRVTLRVNIAAAYRVADPVRATQAVTDFADALHRALQLAFRKTLGGLTLDQLLADKVAVDAEAAEAVRAEMAEIGLDVGEIALKDVILPGEMREILNRVVEAQKEAEANVIRRREETNATRSLLNTAKVMAENPVMLRLKELEALEAIAGKVERLTVTNGTEGLLTDVVRLRD